MHNDITLYQVDQGDTDGRHVSSRRLAADAESTYSVTGESFYVIHTTNRDEQPMRLWVLTAQDHDGHARVFEVAEDTRQGL
jgi:uncharacterized protein YpmB